MTMTLTNMNLDEVLPNGMTRREAAEAYRQNEATVAFDKAVEGGREVTRAFNTSTGTTVKLLNASAILMFVCAAILIFMGVLEGPRGIGIIGMGIGTAISGVLFKALSNIVGLLTDIRDKM